MWQNINKPINSKRAISLLIVLTLIVGGCLVFGCISISFPQFPAFPQISISWPSIPSLPTPPWVSPKVEGFKKFASEDEFKTYLQEAKLRDFTGLGAARMRSVELPEWTEAVPIPMASGEGKGLGETPDRVSGTTVQVVGIDEPDIVKTDGKEIYFSSISAYWMGSWERTEILPPQRSGVTRTIKAFPPADLVVEAKIDKTGNLLLYEDILVIFSGDKIYGYDVSSPESPEKKWTMELESQNYVSGARLYKDKIYLILSTRIHTPRPCPIKPLTVEGTSLEIRCVDIYHPVAPVPIDVTYTAMIVNLGSGKIENNISFVGTSGSSIVYMSENGLYVTYSYYESMINFITGFFTEKCRDIIPNWVIDKLEKLEGYDISDTAKLTEFQVIFEQFQASLDDDERLRIENELTNRMEDYYKEHIRKLEKTGVVKIGLDDFKVLATGTVPGRPLNQFSLDEYQDHLRIATTLGGSWGIIGGTRESANDVYVLDNTLKTTGSVKGLGLTERIYSVRFIEDKGYVVTFRQIDPFYVLDLSNPKNPELKGELKIPGYSSYLHPVAKDKILGIGKEGSNVKISLFDVSNPENPTEKAKYNLDEYWSDVLNTHHAFLLDKKHTIFFLPGNKGGYVFSYKGDQLKLEKAVSGIRAKRALYINDYLYIIGDDKISVLNEINWEKVNEIELSS